MAIINALGQDGGTGTQVLMSNGGAVAPTFQPAGSAAMAFISGATYTTIQEMNDTFHSAGTISGGSITDAGSETIDVSAGTGFIRATDSDVAELVFFDWNAVSGTSVPTNTTRYIGIEYNAGSPQVVLKSSYDWDLNTDFPIGNVVNEGGTLHIDNSPHKVGDHAGQMIDRLYDTMKFRRDELTGGLILGETGTRNITVSAGNIWERLNKVAISAIDTSAADTFTIYYRDGVGGFTAVTAQTQWPNTEYDDGSGSLVTMTNNRFANIWFYLETDGNLVAQYGRNEFTSLAAAQAESPPDTAPDRILIQAFLLGRIVFQKSAGTADSVESAFSTFFSGSQVSDHGSLSGLTDDDHTQYLLADGTRALAGAWDMNSQATTNANIDSGAIDGTTIGATTPAAGTFDSLTVDDISGSYADAEQVFKQAGVQTTDATVTQGAAITLSTNTMVTVEARINGFRSDYSASCGGRIFYVARRVAGSAVEVGAPVVDVIEDSASAPTVDADVSGNDVRLLVQGVAGQTWNWVVTYNYNFTKTNA